MKLIGLTLTVILMTRQKYDNTRRKPTANSIYLKGGVSCSNDAFVVTGTFVLLINICGESPSLRVAANPYAVRLKDNPITDI